MTLTAHTARIRQQGKAGTAFTAHARSVTKRLVYTGSPKHFQLAAPTLTMAQSPFPEGGMALKTRRIGGKTYHVIRGYGASGGHADFVRGHKLNRF